MIHFSLRIAEWEEGGSLGGSLGPSNTTHPELTTISLATGLTLHSLRGSFFSLKSLKHLPFVESRSPTCTVPLPWTLRAQCLCPWQWSGSQTLRHSALDQNQMTPLQPRAGAGLWRERLLGKEDWGPPGGPVVKTLSFHCRGHRFNSW